MLLALRQKGRAVELPDTLIVTSPIYIECVRVPAGEFLMGSALAQDREATKGEQPQHRVYLAQFYIGRHPVTNGQYAAFVKSTGYEAPSSWAQEGMLAGKEDYPVVHASWHDARAFCGWLSGATRRRFRLPTEVEWEKTARGPHARIYPWGDRPPTAALCNCDMRVGHTTPAGQYAKNVSPYGALDLAGNALEWTNSLYRPYPHRADDGQEDPLADELRVQPDGLQRALRLPAEVCAGPQERPQRFSGAGRCIRLAAVDAGSRLRDNGLPE